jgi:DNA invertase Pin-like site-specific DNA recombinase
MRAGVYCRISRDPEGLRAGVTRQEQDCRRHCEERGWEVADVYVDNDVGAYSGKPRPQYRRLLEDLEADRIGAVVAWHNDRLHRSPRELEEFITAVERTGATVAMVTGGDYDLTSADGRLAARIVGAVARKESEDKSRRLRRKHQELAEAGKPAGRGRSYGYEPVEPGRPSKGLQVVATEAAIIEEMAERVLDGQSLRSLVADLNRRGEVVASGRPWSVNALKRVLVSGRIAGLREHRTHTKERGVIAQATWPAIIDRETHDLLRDLLTDPKRLKNHGLNARSYLLSGLVYCGDCGAKMFARPRGDGARRYCCAGSRPGHQLVRMAEPVDAVVRDQVLMMANHRGVTGALQKVSREDTQGRALAAEVAKVEKLLERAHRAHFVEDVIDRDTYLVQRAELEDRLLDLQTRLSSHTDGRVLNGLPTGDRREWWEAATLDEKRELVSTFARRVILLPAVRGLNKFDPDRVRIGWRREVLRAWLEAEFVEGLLADEWGDDSGVNWKKLDKLVDRWEREGLPAHDEAIPFLDSAIAKQAARVLKPHR